MADGKLWGMSPLERWNDERLDELNQRVNRMSDVSTTVAVVRSEQATLKVEVGRANEGIAALSRKLGEVADEPLIRGRNFRSQMMQGFLAALAGGLIVFLSTLASGLIH